MADETPNPNSGEHQHHQPSEITNEATIIDSIDRSNSELSVKKPDTSAVSAPADDDIDDKSLEFSDELLKEGNAALKDNDFSEAADCFSRALEIRVSHHGELAPECIYTYYKFGLALLYKAQEEADPLGAMPKKDAESQQDSVKVDSTKKNAAGESSIAFVSSDAEQCASSSQQRGSDDVPTKSEEDKDEESDMEDGEGEEESELDLSWKMLDIARAICEKHSKDTLQMVDILSALAEVSLEREEIETSLSDYMKALSILENLVESDSRRIAELNFRISICLEVGSRAPEAIPYCQKAISVCKSRMQRLMDEMNSTSAPTTVLSAVSDAVEGAVQSSVASQSDNLGDVRAEIQTLKSLTSDLEKKLEDLQQLVSNPSSIVSDILGLVAAKANAKLQAVDSAAASSSHVGVANNNGSFDSPTVSTADTNGTSGVTHLGVVGRGVKRVSPVDSSATKRPAVDPKPDTDGSTGS